MYFVINKFGSICQLRTIWQSKFPVLPVRFYNNDGFAPPDNSPSIPPYREKIGEPVRLRRARLLYQSRKRGMSENGLILSSFANKYLNSMSEEELSIYDRLINLPSNDWDIYYWITGMKPVPSEFDNAIMDKLKKFVQNENKEDRTRQPDLHILT